MCNLLKKFWYTEIATKRLVTNEVIPHSFIFKTHVMGKYMFLQLSLLLENMLHQIRHLMKILLHNNTPS